MKNNISLIITLLFLVSYLLPGTDGQIRGNVANLEGEGMVGAQIYIEELGIGAVADENGNYILLNVSVGFESVPSLRGGATSTFDEAHDLLAFCIKEKLKHLILVTDSFHTRRALYA